MKAMPLFSNVFVKPLPLDKLVKSGIEIIHVDEGLNSSTRGNLGAMKGEVVKVGPGSVLSSGECVLPSVREGDVVLFEASVARPLLMEGEEYWILRERKILSVLHDKEGNSVEGRVKPGLADD